ncbi:MAG: PQQ-binding-like beta-propeller repeat protein [Planctomycetota bacterium]|nr:PQQ-binding-like beta-propeller repeat protein [Planctomycetota bacterium]
MNPVVRVLAIMAVLLLASAQADTRPARASLRAPARSAVQAQPASGEARDAPWPHFHGPRYDNSSPETGLLKTWPAAGPRLLWKYADCGHGFSSVTVADGLIYSAGDFDGDCMLFALRPDGALAWKAQNGAAWMGAVSGSRSTPTWNDGLLYHLNAHGRLACFEARTGKPVWSVDLYKQYGLQRLAQFGYAESVVVWEDKVFAMPGGAQGFVVALNKKTGAVLWECPNPGSDKASYCTPSLADVNGVRQLLYLSYFRVLGVEAATGRMAWSERHFPNAKHLTVLTVPPLYRAGMVFITAPYEEGAKCYRLNPDGKGLTEAWAHKNLDNEHSGVVIVGEHLYGFGGYRYPLKGWIKKEVAQGVLYCLELKTGKEEWSKPLGRCMLTAADGMLYLRHELGDVYLLEASPKEPALAGQFKLPETIGAASLNHPVIAGGRLYLRSLKTLYVYDVKN